MVPAKRRPSHPGDILCEEFLKPKGMSQAKLAMKMGVSVGHVNSLINGRRAVTATTAILLSRALRTSPEFWMKLQVAFDLHEAQRKMESEA